MKLRTLATLALLTASAAAGAASLTARQAEGELSLAFEDVGEYSRLSLDSATPDWRRVEVLLAKLDQATRDNWLQRLQAMAAGPGQWSLQLSDDAESTRVRVIQLPDLPDRAELLELERNLTREGEKMAAQAQALVAELEMQGHRQLQYWHRHKAAMVESLIRDQEFSDEELRRLRQALDEKAVK
ncbi:hypothetical protein SAMN04488540_102174 [Ferrimonas sediminum]|uniref:Uncharacterized protein n=1 Tax=Ferrimonas sediminum TaxID=718193 RepID=A0A1G8LUE0_9GAMM|nr:hypothetical protein [Ferrimonas sediminum]SDI59265.1 hypothetical protein SAMN04488540_102174 [Ferrimonas sediminum]